MASADLGYRAAGTLHFGIGRRRLRHMDQMSLMHGPPEPEPCPSNIPRVRPGDLRLLDEVELRRLVGVVGALADPIRVQIIHLLGQRSDLCTCELEALLGLAQSKVSYHLKVLLDAGIVARERHGTWSHYSLRTREILRGLRALNA